MSAGERREQLVQDSNRVRGPCVCKASCRRRAKFSRTRSSRERKELTSHARRCRSDTVLARILSELSEFSFAPSHSFCRCTTFRRDTPSLRRSQLRGWAEIASSALGHCYITIQGHYVYRQSTSVKVCQEVQ